MLLTLILSVFSQTADAESLQRRENYLRELKVILPRSDEWEEWQRESGELPPDFSTMPSQGALPDVFTRYDDEPGTIGTPEQWREHRQALLDQFHYWIIGSVPETPETVAATVLRTEELPGGRLDEVELRFGPDNKAKLWIEVMVPGGTGPFPVFMTQHNHRGWARIAFRRGYLAVIYAGADSRDDTGTFIDAYPAADWSKLTRRAWAAGRVIDYLETRPQADTSKIALTGHSRNGKQSLIGAALDERISVVISSSSGAGGPLPTRLYSEQHFGEGIENITRVFPDWFHPRWRFFVGREHKLLVDQHQLVALSAPRPVLLSTAINDGVESYWAMEMAYRAIKPAWELFSKEDNLRIMYRPHGHETYPEVIERFIDWCDLHFGRRTFEFPERLIYPWEGSVIAQGMQDSRIILRKPLESIDSVQGWQARRQEIRYNVSDTLGGTPDEGTLGLETYGEEPNHIEALLRRQSAGGGLEKHDVMFGEYLNGDVYAPDGTADSGAKIPAILWLHPVSNSTGYVAAYRRGEQAYRTFARAGYAVFCYDQIGHGRRISEIERFYQHHGNWSLMGKLVRDARAALSAMEQLPYVDPDRIYVAGYSTGAFVALHLGLCDDRPDGFALVSAPPPFRFDDPGETGGIERWSKWHLLIPRLGRIGAVTEDGEERMFPYDIDDLLASLAPRPTLVLSPTLDREAPLEAVTKGVESARGIFRLVGAEDALTHRTPLDYNHFDTRMQHRVVTWLESL